MRLSPPQALILSGLCFAADREVIQPIIAGYQVRALIEDILETNPDIPQICDGANVRIAFQAAGRKAVKVTPLYASGSARDGNVVACFSAVSEELSTGVLIGNQQIVIPEATIQTSANVSSLSDENDAYVEFNSSGGMGFSLRGVAHRLGFIPSSNLSINFSP